MRMAFAFCNKDSGGCIILGYLPVQILEQNHGAKIHKRAHII
jgi:hypothetical protein